MIQIFHIPYFRKSVMHTWQNLCYLNCVYIFETINIMDFSAKSRKIRNSDDSDISKISENKEIFKSMMHTWQILCFLNCLHI